MKLFALILTALPGTAMADGLDCTFTTICSPQTDCQTHPGVPFEFDIVAGGISFFGGDRVWFGTPLRHLTAPAYSAIFQTQPESTILFTVTGTGEAVLTQQDLMAGGGIQSVSYFGTCEPVA